MAARMVGRIIPTKRSATRRPSAETFLEEEKGEGEKLSEYERNYNFNEIEIKIKN